MRRTLSYMMLLLLAAGCTRDQKTVYDPDMQMQFHPVMHIPSKAEADENYPEGQPFAVSAWTLDEQLLWDTDMASAESYLSDVAVSFSEIAGWVLDESHLWPSADKNLTAIGYSPVGSFTSCTAEKGVSCSYDMTADQTDLLYTDPQKDLDKVECGGIISLPFRHALSQIDFEVKNRVTKDEEILIKSISIDGVKCRGSFTSLPEPVWVTEDEEMTLVFFEGNEDTRNLPEEIGRTWNVIPQALSTKVTVEYEYRTAADTGFTLTLKTCDLQTNLKPGRHYTYTLAVGIDEVQFLLEIIEDRFK